MEHRTPKTGVAAIAGIAKQQCLGGVQIKRLSKIVEPRFQGVEVARIGNPFGVTRICHGLSDGSVITSK